MNAAAARRPALEVLATDVRPEIVAFASADGSQGTVI